MVKNLTHDDDVLRHRRRRRRHRRRRRRPCRRLNHARRKSHLRGDLSEEVFPGLSLPGLLIDLCKVFPI